MHFQRAQRIATNEANVASTGFNTSAFSVDHADIVTVEVILTRSASTATFFIPYISTNGGTTWSALQAESIAAGVATLTDYTPTKTTSASGSWAANIAPNVMHLEGGSGMMRLAFDSTAGDTGDLVTVNVVVGRT